MIIKRHRSKLNLLNLLIPWQRETTWIFKIIWIRVWAAGQTAKRFTSEPLQTHSWEKSRQTVIELLLSSPRETFGPIRHSNQSFLSSRAYRPSFETNMMAQLPGRARQRPQAKVIWMSTLTLWKDISTIKTTFSTKLIQKRHYWLLFVHTDQRRNINQIK